ncbi:MAG: hypothetical protein QOE93_1095 [Actinomycetota bacterium]|jgi:hypothetical protein|nr:hypothetical protein [Actinomycetota bacterium]
MRKPSVVRVALVVVIAAGFPTPALAVWTAVTASPGSGRANAMALTAGNVPTITSVPTSSTVGVSWTAVTGGAPVSGYEIRSFDATSGVPRTVGSTCSGIVTGTSCTEAGVPDGVWKYSVTARQQLWKGAESVRSAAFVIDTTAPFPTASALSDGDGSVTPRPTG